MKNPVALDYSQKLQDLLGVVFGAIDAPYLILRDQEKLPKQSGFDIDLLIDEKDRASIISLCHEYAQNQGVMAVDNTKRIVLFDLSYDNSKRNWAIIDLQSEYKYGAKSMDIHEMLSMEEGERKKLIKDVQDARKGRASKEVQERLGITPYVKKAPITRTKAQNIKRSILLYGFFIHKHVMPFIVISGPDGVGKTTLMSNILKLFDNLPFKTDNFHHTGLGKSQQKTVEVKEENMSLARKLRRRYTPKFIKVIYGAVTAEIRYAMRINKKVVENFYSATLTFSDRYIYDRAVKMRMIEGKVLVTKITTRINAYLMRRPTVMIVPTDSPDAIYKRKQELNPDEIKHYYNELDNFINKCSIPCVHKVAVAGKTPEELAEEATREILRSLPKDLIFRAIGMYERELKR